MREQTDATAAAETGSRIHVIRGQRVLLDSDLAALYGVTTKRFTEQVRRNQVLEQARTAGPQAITRSGNLAEFFARSPLRGSELKLRRPRGGSRPIKL